MYEIWANLGLLIMVIIVGGILWFVLYMIGTAIFEDFLGRFINKFKRKPKKEDDDDFYVY
ncbi:MAG TPA: hypothetical protein VK186_07080 [Candidatus Deferrimicrobium sp.]|nr:hypothetical protein [Candidatus Kapabacteria bacterium]HLP58572.1 hypothetical protein [Candidatus Deferrimicrobium sp.]